MPEILGQQKEIIFDFKKILIMHLDYLFVSLLHYFKSVFLSRLTFLTFVYSS